ncbi:MAG: hypothetical protein AB7P37_19590 [Ramlibacter sp.]
MLSDLLNKIVDAPRESLFLAGVAVVIGALLSSMYIVCSGQVQSAEARHAAARTQRMAVLDCLDSDPRASYAACASHVALTFQPQPGAQVLRVADGAAPMRASSPSRGFNKQVSVMMPVAYYSR